MMVDTWFALDLCNFTYAVGFGRLVYNMSLFSYDWGRIESFSISEFLTLRSVKPIHNNSGAFNDTILSTCDSYKLYPCSKLDMTSH